MKAYLTEDYMDYVDWQWKGIDDLNPVTHEQGIRMALENNTKSYKEILGPDWQEKLEQIAEERQWFADHNITHPAEKLLSGGETEMSKKLSNEETTNEEIDNG